jgi:hypothetical protein
VVLERMVGWCPDSTLHCMLHLWPFQWWHWEFRLNVTLLMLH